MHSKQNSKRNLKEKKNMNEYKENWRKCFNEIVNGYEGENYNEMMDTIVFYCHLMKKNDFEKIKNKIIKHIKETQKFRINLTYDSCYEQYIFASQYLSDDNILLYFDFGNHNDPKIPEFFAENTTCKFLEGKRDISKYHESLIPYIRTIEQRSNFTILS